MSVHLVKIDHHVKDVNVQDERNVKNLKQHQDLVVDQHWDLVEHHLLVQIYTHQQDIETNSTGWQPRVREQNSQTRTLDLKVEQLI